MFDKKEVLNKVLVELERNLQTLVKVAHDARHEATHEDAKAENKYDTRGLEAAYLAGAQAKRAKELRDVISQFQKLNLRNYMDTTPIESTALVEVEINGQERKWFFLLPDQGGVKVRIEETDIHVITPKSPIGKSLYQNTVGHFFVVNGNEYEVTEVW